MIPLQILGWGHSLPERTVDNQELAALVGRSPGWIGNRTGVQNRHWVKKETAPELAAEAARKALSSAGLKASDLDLLINASGTPAQAMPDGSALLQQCLGEEYYGLAGMSIHSSCLSFLQALQVAGALLVSGQYQRILICASEITSRALDFDQPESASLFGDAAAAVVVGRTPEAEDSRLVKSAFATYGQGAELCQIRGGGSTRHPQAKHTRPRDNLFQMKPAPLLRMALHHLPEFALALDPEPESTDLLVPHQASKAGCDLVGRLHWPEQVILSDLHRFGNTVAASIPLALSVYATEHGLSRGQKIVLLGTGAGFSLGGLVLRY